MNKHEVKFYNTERRIKAALIELLKTKNLSDISVSELCSKADIHRSTFYAHYDNTTELVVDLEQSLTADFFKKNEALAKVVADNDAVSLKDSMLTLKTVLSECLDYLKKHRHLFVFYGAGVFGNGSDLAKHVNELLFIPILNANGIKDETQIDYMLTCYVAGVNSIIEKWIKEGCTKSPEEIFAIIQKCFNLLF